MKRAFLLAMILGLALPAVARSQGVLVVVDPGQSIRLPRPIPPIVPPRPPVPRPEPEPSYKVESIEAQARLIDQIAQVQVSQTFVNTGSAQLEVSFVFPLPYDGAIDQMTLMVDGKEYPAELLDAEKARRAYEEIVRKNKDPALLEWVGTGMFRTSVFPVPAGAKRTVSLRYSQLLRWSEGVTDFLFPLSTAKYTARPVDKVSIRLTIESAEEIKSVYSPTHEVNVKRPSDRHATISYEATQAIPSDDFRLLYDVDSSKIGMQVLSYRPDKGEDGYFLLLAAPRIAGEGEPQKKTVLFVLDRSGSMSGEKIQQARDSLKFVLNNLRDGDTFNIVAYDSRIELFRPELQRVDDESRKAAIAFCDAIYAGGSTNIDGALKTALEQLTDSGRPNYVIFLTDGLPTTGVTNEMQIAANALDANRVGARIFSFGVGYDVNSRLLDKLARDSHGQSDYVLPKEHIEARVSRLYRRIESPVMTDIRLTFDLDEKDAGSVVNRVYPSDRCDLFAGEQLVMVGRYRVPGEAKVTIAGSVGSKEESFDFGATLVGESHDEKYAFIEKLWAVRRIGEILDELDLKGKNQELIEELVRLSTRHGILTPYTSFLADENTRLHDVAANAQRADRELDSLGIAEGYAGVVQRGFKNQLQYGHQSQAAAPDDAFRMRMELAAPASAYPSEAGSMMQRPSVAGSTPGRAAAGGYGSGYGDARGGPAVTARLHESEEVAPQAAAAMRQIGNRAFFQREGRWVDSTLTAEQETALQTIRQFSDEYFALIRRHGRTISQYLVFDEPLLLNVDGQAYLVEP